jgi:hypothetical protein
VPIAKTLMNGYCSEDLSSIFMIMKKCQDESGVLLFLYNEGGIAGKLFERAIGICLE